MFFELQDVKRRHNPHWWSNNVTGWHTAVDSTPAWNYQRGLIIGLTAGTIQQYFCHFKDHFKAMLKHYEPPTNFNEWVNFIKSTRNLQSFSSGLKSRMQIGAVTGAFAIAPQVALLRQFNSGWSTMNGAVEWSIYRKIPTILSACILSSPFAVTLEMVQRAYFADKTFPKELQKGYKSFLDAFKRIPFEEGPYYLFKGTFPHYMKHMVGPFIMFYVYDWSIDKLSVLWRIASMPVLPIVTFTALFSTYLGALVTYPFAVKARQLVDLAPYKGGLEPFDNNYRKAAYWIWTTDGNVKFFGGFFKNYFWNIAPQWFITLMLAEKMGIFKYWRIDIMHGAADNNQEDAFI